MKWNVVKPTGDTRQVTLSETEMSTLADVAVQVDQLLLSMLPPGSLLPGRPTFTTDMLT